MSDNWLENLKPGDEVFVETAYPESPDRLTVKRVSRDRIYLDDTIAVFRRFDGICVTWTGYTAPALYPLTDELQMRNWLKQQILAELRYAKNKAMRSSDAPSISQLQACLAFLRSAKDALNG